LHELPHLLAWTCEIGLAEIATSARRIDLANKTFSWDAALPAGRIAGRL
jgi:hypothetical protein